MPASSWFEDSSDSNSSYVLSPSSHHIPHGKVGGGGILPSNEDALDHFNTHSHNSNYPPPSHTFNDSYWPGFTDDAFDGSGAGMLPDDSSGIDWGAGAEADVTWDLAFRDSCRFWVQHVLVPIVVIIGVMGNAVTIYILTRRPMRSSTNV